ncbi:MAG: hypothetical protein RIS58_1222, partial [Actinomycetota bacterium]
LRLSAVPASFQRISRATSFVVVIDTFRISLRSNASVGRENAARLASAFSRTRRPSESKVASDATFAVVTFGRLDRIAEDDCWCEQDRSNDEATGCKSTDEWREVGDETICHGGNRDAERPIARTVCASRPTGNHFSSLANWIGLRWGRGHSLKSHGRGHFRRITVERGSALRGDGVDDDATVTTKRREPRHVASIRSGV